MRIAIAALLWMYSAQGLAAAPCDSAVGTRLFSTKCATCHTFAKDGSNGAGPNLRGVVGRKAGTVAGFAYSPALKALGILWSREALDGFLRDPQARVAGTYMAFTGVKRDADRQAIICFLESLQH